MVVAGPQPEDHEWKHRPVLDAHPRRSPSQKEGALQSERSKQTLNVER